MDDVVEAAHALEEAALAPELFPTALSVVARTFGATTLGLVNAAHGVPAIIGSAGAEDMHREYFAGGWHELDLRHQAFVRAGPTQGAVKAEHSLVPASVRSVSPFYQEFCKRFDGMHCASWSYVLDGEAWGYSILYGAKAGPPQSTDLEKLERLAPYAIRAGILATRFATTRAIGIAEGLACARRPAIVLDYRGQCVFATAEAESVFDEEFGLKSSRLWAADAQSRAELNRLSAAAGLPYRTIRPEYVVVRRNRSARPLLVMPVPVVGRGLDAWPMARLVVTIIDMSAQASLDLQLLRRALDLTLAEARIAAALARGYSPEEIAGHASLAVSTVRQSIKSILAKTGTHRQAELVALLRRLE
jgi:DNA-binding CsgD family transcriptional regulator